MKRDLKNPLAPPRVPNVATASTDGAKKEMARVSNTEAGVCPVPGCGKQMEVLECADNIPAYVCLGHRVALPVENSRVSK